MEVDWSQLSQLPARHSVLLRWKKLKTIKTINKRTFYRQREEIISFLNYTHFLKFCTLSITANTSFPTDKHTQREKNNMKRRKLGEQRMGGWASSGSVLTVLTCSLYLRDKDKTGSLSPALRVENSHCLLCHCPSSLSLRETRFGRTWQSETTHASTECGSYVSSSRKAMAGKFLFHFGAVSIICSCLCNRTNMIKCMKSLQDKRVFCWKSCLCYYCQKKKKV